MRYPYFGPQRGNIGLRARGRLESPGEISSSIYLSIHQHLVASLLTGVSSLPRCSLSDRVHRVLAQGVPRRHPPEWCVTWLKAVGGWVFFVVVWGFLWFWLCCVLLGGGHVSAIALYWCLCCCWSVHDSSIDCRSVAVESRSEYAVIVL